MTNPAPRLTRQDIRANPSAYLETGHSDWLRANEELAANTPCEHQYHLTDSCPGCDHVEEVLDEATPAQRRAYWLIVKYWAAHLCPQRLDKRTVQALARRGLVDIHTNPATGAWTAVHVGQETHTENFTHVDVDLA